VVNQFLSANGGPDGAMAQSIDGTSTWQDISSAAGRPAQGRRQHAAAVGTAGAPSITPATIG
jgi:hypothetical protein